MGKGRRLAATARAPDAPQAAAGAVEPPGAAAFFDFDKTLLHGDAGVIFGLTLANWSYLQARGSGGVWQRRRQSLRVTGQIARMAGQALVYRGLNQLGILKRSRLVELSYRFLKGLPSDEMAVWMEKVWQEKLRERLYPQMMQVLERHRQEGRRIVIVTTGLRVLVEHSRQVLGPDVEVVGVEMLENDGVWLGAVEGPLYGVHKAEAITAYARDHGIDLKRSWAYSDHYSDVAFLAVVGNPVAVNPRLRLGLHARKHGWRVLRVDPPSRAKPSSQVQA